VRLAIDPQGNPWVINTKNLIYKRDNNGGWKRVPGRATDIGIGANGQVFVISVNKVRGGRGLWKWNNTARRWSKFSGGGIRVDVDAKGNPWVIDTQDILKRWTGKKWESLPGKGNEFSIGPDGDVMAIANKKIWRWKEDTKFWH